jgi:hypothetical protein
LQVPGVSSVADRDVSDGAEVKKNAPSNFAGYTKTVRILFMLRGTHGLDLT